MKEKMEAVQWKFQEPGSERFATIGPSHVVQVLPLCLGEPVAVIQGSPADPFCRNYRRCSLLAHSASTGARLT